jgi:Peptidase family C25
MFEPLLFPFEIQMKSIYRLFFVSFLMSMTFSQIEAQSVFQVDQELLWFDLDQRSETTGLGFDQGFCDDPSNELPYFFKRLRLKNFASVSAYRFQTEEVTSLPQNLLSNLGNTTVNSDWKVIAEVTDGGGIPYLVVRVYPIRKQGDSYQRLLSFSLSVEYNDGGSRPAVSRDLSFAENSVLSEGTWFKIAIARDGVYKMDKSFLSSLGVDVAHTDPHNINLYGNGGTLLPTENSVPRKDDLKKNAIVFQGESDGSIDNGDYIAFYGKGPDTWATDTVSGIPVWLHTKHYYSDSAYYFLRVDDSAPLRIQQAISPTGSANVNVNTFQDYQFVENDQINLAKSGREFYGDVYDDVTNTNYTFSMPNLTSDPALIQYAVASRTITNSSTYTLSSFGQTSSVSLLGVSESTTGDAASIGTGAFTVSPSGSSIVVNVNYLKGNAEAIGYLDYIRVNATRQLTMANSQMRFRNVASVGASNIASFQLSNANSAIQVWDITDDVTPSSIAYTLTGTVAEWKSNTDQLKEFIAFSNFGYLTPTAKGEVANQNLHALSNVDLIIISAPGLKSVASDLAEVHTALGETVALTTTLEIFNEFSSGNPDVSAIKTFMKMFYDRAAGNPDLMPQNLLLFGDGTYLSNKGYKAQTGNNVMVFESNNSISPTVSSVSDDFYVQLSNNEGISSSGSLDCGVGRIPASTLQEASDFVEKIKIYIADNTSSTGDASCLGDEVQTSYGPWRNIITFVSDDQDGNGGPFEQVHLANSDQLADSIYHVHPQYDVVKLYMDAFKQETTPGGERYPDGAAAIQRRIQEGSLLVCYIGHGGEKGWAHERILDIPTIQNFSNLYKMPVFLTATCELARYDDPSFKSAGENLLMNSKGGAIAMLTTTRIVYSGSNFEIDKAFFNNAFQNEVVSDLSLGKINQLTKNESGNGNTSRPNFSLLGDPAIKMRYPQKRVFTTHINNSEIATFADTLKALQEVEFKGFVGDLNGVKLTGFNGFIYPVVYDKKSHVETLNNDVDGVVQDYDVYNKVIYKGKSSVVNGDFSFKFVVPYDINYRVDTGRVSYYAVAGSVDADGYQQKFKIGSSLSGALLNTVGPEISLFMNDSTFVSGGITNTKPVLLARLKDDNGINTVGNGIGHDITVVLDNDIQNPIVVNDYYQADLNTYKSGEVRYQMTDLPVGEHNLELKAWDVHNNSTSQTMSFVVAENATVALDHVLNYPNPFTTHTSFMFEHNQACTELDVRIQVFTVSGKLVKTINQTMTTSGYRSEPLAWDGTDDFGDRIGRGVYVYKLEVRTGTGAQAEKYEKLVILK